MHRLGHIEWQLQVPATFPCLLKTSAFHNAQNTRITGLERERGGERLQTSHHPCNHIDHGEVATAILDCEYYRLRPLILNISVQARERGYWTKQRKASYTRHQSGEIKERGWNIPQPASSSLHYHGPENQLSLGEKHTWKQSVGLLFCTTCKLGCQFPRHQSVVEYLFYATRTATR